MRALGAELVEVPAVPYKNPNNYVKYSARLAEVLVGHGIELVAMAGFGTVLSEPMQDAFGGRLINTHPALLPSFKGWHAVRDALAYGVKVTGCTVHHVTLEVDAGKIIEQASVPVEPGDTLETLTAKVHAAEHKLLPAVIARLSQTTQ